MTGTTEQQLRVVSVLDVSLPGMVSVLCVQLVFWLCLQSVWRGAAQFASPPSL